MSSTGLISLSTAQASAAAAVFERLYPEDDESPGATSIGVLTYVDRALAGAYRSSLSDYRLGLDALDHASWTGSGLRFSERTPTEQDQMLASLEAGTLGGFGSGDQRTFFSMLRDHCIEGIFSDPAYGGNRDKLGWKSIGHPGVWLENSAEEQLSDKPVTKDGVVQSLEDAGFSFGGREGADQPLDGYDPDRGLQGPARDVEVLLIGVGGVGGLLAQRLTRAGLRVVGLEAGPFWKTSDFVPDELGSTYYCRASLGDKFAAEAPRWRRDAKSPTQPATYSLGRMVNGVGGSIIHYGGWMRRYHEHHLRWRSHIVERWGESAIPDDCSVTDWPVEFSALEPHYTDLEQEMGIAGDDSNPFVQRSRPLPLPPMRPFRLGERFREASESLGLHPHPSPVTQNTEPYNGYPETTYCGWNNGFGAWDGDKWHPGLTYVQEALATGNLDLRTHCRVTRVVTDQSGRATGVEYMDREGNSRVQHAEVVVLAAYTYESIRLMFLSGTDKRPDGLGNSAGQLGLHHMTKQFSHVDGFFPDTIFNRHTGPASQAMIMDDFLSESFDSVSVGGFVGGATLGCENQFLPIQIARETLPPDVPGWGMAYKEHVRAWQHLGVVRVQADALPYRSHTIDLDPTHRERSRLGLPVVRITYDLRENEQKQAGFFEAKCSEILEKMGATQTWSGPRFTGVCSSHDLGGCRMSEDPAAGVVSPALEVHDTPGLYVFSGAVMPSCPGINPSLTLFALCAHAGEQLVERLRGRRAG